MLQHHKTELAAFYKLFECQHANISPWVSHTPWHVAHSHDQSDSVGTTAMSLFLPCAHTAAPAASSAALGSPPQPLLHQAQTKKAAPHILYPYSLAQTVPRCHLSLAEQMNRCHLWEKMSRAGRHSSPDKMAQPCSWTESQGGRAAREPQHQFPPNSQKNTVCYVLQKPHLINLLCTPALWWEF